MANFAPPPPMPDFENKKKFPWKVFFIIVIAVVIIAWSFFIGLLLGSETAGVRESATLPEVENIDGAVEGDETDVTLDQPATTADAQTLQVEWTDVSGQKARGTYSSWNDVVFGGEPLLPEDGIGPKAFALGTIRGGAYDGRELQMYIAGLPGMGTLYQMYYVIPGNGTVPMVVLDRYAGSVGEAFSRPTRQVTASELLGEEGLARLANYKVPDDGPGAGAAIVLDTGSKIAELEEVVSVKDDRGQNFKLVGEWSRVNYPLDVTFVNSANNITLTNGRVLNQSAKDKNKPFADNLFYYTREDGRMVFYVEDLGIGIEQTNGESMGVPNVVWGPGIINSASYSVGAIGGCGTSNSYHTVSESTFSSLKEAGYYERNSGDVGARVTVYEPKDYSSADYGLDYWLSNHDGKTVTDFAALHPYFYVRDSFNQLVEFQGSDFMPVSECGKPVIYLYPTKTTDIDVILKPTGGFTYTEPVYQNGWRVTASPDGTLVNRDDGQSYPYLFWEGRGGLYSSPTKFWVVKKSDVHSFLVSTLAELGLNQKETIDFIEFWEPRMQSANYYKIGFHGTEVMNQIAPLSLSQKADTTLRILMDYQELSAPIAANPPTLPATPVRKGFAVVEWGGVIR